MNHRLLLALPLGLLLGAATTPAHAGAREFKQARQKFEAALDAYRKARQADDLEKAEVEAGDAADTMLREEPRDAVKVLVDEGVPAPRPIAKRVLTILGTLDNPKATAQLTKLYGKADTATQRLLTPVLAKVKPAEDALKALEKALKSKDDVVLSRALEAVGKRAKEAAGLEFKVKRLLKDSSARVRFQAARALEALTGALPEGFAPAKRGPFLLPERFDVDRVAFLFDETRITGERDFVDPATAGEGRADGGADAGAGADKPQPEPHSITDLIAKGLAERFSSPPELEVHLRRFGGTNRPYQKGFNELDKRDLPGLKSWLERPGRERQRRLREALEATLEQSPAPEEVYVFLAGPPLDRRPVTNREVIDAVRDLTWGQDVVVHVIGFLTSPRQPPEDAQTQAYLAKVEGEYRQLCQQLAASTGGQAKLIALARVPTNVDDGSGAGADDTELDVDLAKALSRRDLKQVEAAFRRALSRAEAADLELIEKVAACPDAKLLDLLLEAARAGSLEVEAALARGLGTNSDAKLKGRLMSATARAKTVREQQALLAVWGNLGGQEVTDELVKLIDSAEGDVLRRAWAALSGRPATELATHKSKLSRAGKKLGGHTAFLANRALAQAAGTSAPSSEGLTPKSGLFLPERYVAATALVLDNMREASTTFWAPPPPKEGEEKKGDKARPQPPVTRLAAMKQESERALGALATAQLPGNVIFVDGAAWQRGGAVDLSEGSRLQAARDYVGRHGTDGRRDVHRALVSALEDTAVEQVFLLVCGVPNRNTPGADPRNPEELADQLKDLYLERRIPIHVTYVLEPVGEEQAPARADLIRLMDAVYTPLTDMTGGEKRLAETLAGLDTPDAGSDAGN